MALTKVTSSMVNEQPAFSAYQSTLQSIATNTATKLQFQTKVFDTSSAFNNTGSTVGTAPAYSFNPQIAGYYQITTGFGYNSPVSSEAYIALYKNGSAYQYGTDILATPYIIQGTFLVYLNGSTDYIEIYVGHFSGSSKNTVAASTVTYVSGFMARST